MSKVSSPPVLALFQKRIEGDDALLRLAALRFRQSGLGAEFYAETPGELEWVMAFRHPAQTPAAVHLQRDIDLFEEESRNLVMEFARQFRGRLLGLIVHDQSEVADRFDEYTAVLGKMESQLKEIEAAPFLFVEYASGLPLETYVSLFQAVSDLPHIGSCIDTGHLGLRRARDVFSQSHPGQDVCALTFYDPELPEVVEDVQRAVESSLGAVLEVVGALARVGTPLHFHLHDGHPIWSFSPFGLSDHRSFLTEVPIPFEFRGKQSLHPMFGPSGLFRIVTETLHWLGPDRVSFSLEIHPTEGRLALGDASYLFDHWKDKGNAERMNFWLAVLQQNRFLISEICRMFSTSSAV